MDPSFIEIYLNRLDYMINTLKINLPNVDFIFYCWDIIHDVNEDNLYHFKKVPHFHYSKDFSWPPE